MAAPKFVERVARIPELLAILSAYPEGLTLAELAARFAADPKTIREDLTTYLDLESWGWSFDIFRRSAVEFVQPATDDPDDPLDLDPTTVVRVATDDTSGLGVEHLSAGDLAMIYTAGLALFDVTPDDDLAEALVVISETMYGEPGAPPSASDWHRFLGPLQDARAARRKARIRYSRIWREGVLDREIEPLRLVQTHRGWEVDAGPVGPEGNLRTYVLSNIRDVEVLDETFDIPPDADVLLYRQRETTTARLQLAQDARWAADMYAEEVYVVDEDEDSFEADVELLPPAGFRVGLIMLASGPTTRVLEPTSLLPEAVGVIEELLRHHSDQPSQR